MAYSREDALRYGAANNIQFIYQHLGKSPVTSSILLRGTELYPFMNNFDDQYLAYFGRIMGILRCYDHNVQSVAAEQAVGIGEVLAIHYARDRIPARQDARARVTRLVQLGLTKNIMEEIGNYTADRYLESRLALMRLYPDANLPEDWPFSEAEVAALNADACMAIIYFWCSYSNESISKHAIQSIIVGYCALAKRGNCTDDFAAKIRDLISTELQVNIEIRRDVVAFVYDGYMKTVNETNAKLVFEHLFGLLPALALRLKLTLEQLLVGSRLTVFNIIRVAMVKYNDFYWEQCNVITDGQVLRYREAVRTVRNNPYYGFKRDLGVVKSTMYKSIGYVAKELLIKLGGDMPSRQYQGFNTIIPRKAQLDLLIARYVKLVTIRRQADIPELGEVYPVISEVLDIFNEPWVQLAGVGAPVIGGEQ